MGSLLAYLSPVLSEEQGDHLHPLAARFFRLLVIESICEVSLRFGVQDIAIPDDDTQVTYILVLHSLN